MKTKKIKKSTDYLERWSEPFDKGLIRWGCKIRYDFLKVMPLYKWQYCHEILSLHKDGYCDWSFNAFLHELEYYGTCSERILELDCFTKKQKSRLVTLIKRLKKEATQPKEEMSLKNWFVAGY
tara:strand:- start:178 stop:546 length:369 start_codon:yes stop_codon:yes gene_type:complete